MFKIGFFTTSRAEFGILKPVISHLQKSDLFEIKLFVGGMHLANDYGNTVSEIVNSGLKIADTFDYLLNENTSHSLSKSVGIATIELSHIFSKYNFDHICILGDRYELLAIVSNAILFKKSIIHIGGGETTEGSIDEQIRHMITKSAHVHFATTDDYKNKIINMGESEWRVHNSGAPTIDAVKLLKGRSKNDLFHSLGLDSNKKTALLTYHPVTLEFDIKVEDQLKNIFNAIKDFDLQILITSPNIEVDRDKVLKYLKAETAANINYHYLESLGFNRYHNFLKYCNLVIGNSSSGIFEAPFYKIPTINIGKRQNGRTRHQSIIDTDYDEKSIASSLKKGLSPKFLKSINKMEYKFGDGNACNIIHDVLVKVLSRDDILIKKSDY